MAINFPDTPTDGQVFTSGNQSWTYFSTPGVWKVTSGAIGYTGSASTVIGYTGSQGPIGFTGSAGSVDDAIAFAIIFG